MNNVQPIGKYVIASLLCLAFSLPTYAGSAPKCPKPQDIKGSQLRFDEADAWGNTFDLETSRTYPVGTDHNWTFYQDDVPAANQNDALQKGNQHISDSTWELTTEDAVSFLFYWICAYRVDGNLEASAESSVWDTN